MFNALELSEKPLSDLKEIIKDLGAKPNGTKKPDLILQIIALQGNKSDQGEALTPVQPDNKALPPVTEEVKAEKTKRPRKVKLELLPEENNSPAEPAESPAAEPAAIKPVAVMEPEKKPEAFIPPVEKPQEIQQKNTHPAQQPNRPQHQQGQPQHQNQVVV